MRSLKLAWWEHSLGWTPMPAVASLTELHGDTEEICVRDQTAFSQAVFEQVQTLYDWFSCFSDHE